MILSIKSWRTKKKLHKHVPYNTDQNYRQEDSTCIYSCLLNKKCSLKSRGPGLYNSLRHADNRKYFSGLFPTRNSMGAHMFYLARKVGRIWRCSCWEKGNFIMINEFKYRQTWKLNHLHLVYHFKVHLKPLFLPSLHIKVIRIDCQAFFLLSR